MGINPIVFAIFPEIESIYYWVIGIVLTILISVIMYGLFIKNRFGKQTVNSVAVADQKIILTGVIEHKSRYTKSNNTRITVMDIATGRLITTKILYKNLFAIEMIVNGIAWLKPKHNGRGNKDHHEVLGLDLDNLQPVVGEKILKELLQIPVENKISVSFESGEGKLEVITNKKTIYVFNCSDFDPHQHHTGKVFPFRSKNNGLNFYTIQHGEQRQLHHDGELICKHRMFNQPMLLNVWDNSKNEPSEILFYHEADAQKSSGVILEMMDQNGNTIWRKTQEELKISDTIKLRLYNSFPGKYNDHLVFWFNAKEISKIVVMDRRTGNEVWSKLL